MTDWKAISKALGTEIPDDQLDRILPVLEQLERVWEPLRKSIPAGAETWTGPGDSVDGRQ